MLAAVGREGSYKQKELQTGWTLSFQHASSHAGTAGNELADVVADKAYGVTRIAGTPRDASRIFLAQYKARKNIFIIIGHTC